MKKHITNHEEILKLTKDKTSGLHQISSDLTDAMIKEMGFELSESYFYESERGDEKEIYIYKNEEERIVKISNYLEREGGMFVKTTFVPTNVAHEEYKSEIEKELESPSIWLISSILHKRKIDPPGDDYFMDFSGSMNCHHHKIVTKDIELCNKILNRFKELVAKDKYNSENPSVYNKVISVLDKF